MSLIHFLLYNIPTFLLGSLIVTGAVLFSIGGLFVIRSYMPSHQLKLHNDVAGFIFATLGVIYAVLLAFMVIITWQGFDGAGKDVAREANSIAALYRDSTALSPAFQGEVKIVLKQYATAIINDEWPLLAKGERSEKVQAAQERLWRLYGSYRPRTETEKVFFAESVSKLNQAGELRRQRILDSYSGTHPILWFVLFAGGLITISFTMFFGTENFGPQLLMTSLLAVLIALILFTIMALDYPFTGDVSIGHDSFKIILQTLLRAQ